MVPSSEGWKERRGEELFGEKPGSILSRKMGFCVRHLGHRAGLCTVEDSLQHFDSLAISLTSVATLHALSPRDFLPHLCFAFGNFLCEVPLPVGGCNFQMLQMTLFMLPMTVPQAGALGSVRKDRGYVHTNGVACLSRPPSSEFETRITLMKKMTHTSRRLQVASSP